MDIIKQILNVSDIKLLDKVKAFIASCKKEEESALAKENCITVDLQREIDEARQEYKNGETLHFKGAKEAQQWMESL